MMPGKTSVTLLIAAVSICSIVLISVAGERAASGPGGEAEETASPGAPPSGKPVAVEADEADNPAPTTRPATRPFRYSPRRGKRFTPAQETETLEFLKQHRPKHYQRLLELKEGSEGRYRWAARRMYRFMKRWREMPPAIRDATEEERDLQIRIMATVRRIRHAQNADEKATLEKQLKQIVSDHFEAEQVLRGHRLAHLADQIKELRRELAEQRREREEIIAERVARWMKATKPVGPTTRPAEK